MPRAESGSGGTYGAGANDSPTPFSDLLTEMIEAQAIENELIRRHENATARTADTASRAADLMRRVLTQGLNAGIAGLIVTAAIGAVFFFVQESMRQPHVVAAGNDPPKANSPASAGARQEPALRVAEPGGPEKPDVEGERATKHGITTGSIVDARSDQPGGAPPVATQPIENPASDAQKPGQVEAAPEVPSSSEPTQFDTTAAPAANAPSEPLPQAAPSQPPSDETGPASGPSNDAATRSARINSHVRMRAGPGNDQAVVMTIPAGSAVQVVKCQQWCEVIFAGQQGWVYKTFVGTSTMPR